MRRKENKKYFIQICVYQTRDRGLEEKKKKKKDTCSLSPADILQAFQLCILIKSFVNFQGCPQFRAMAQETLDKIFLTKPNDFNPDIENNSYTKFWYF